MGAPWYGIIWVLLIICMFIAGYKILMHYFGGDE